MAGKQPARWAFLDALDGILNCNDLGRGPTRLVEGDDQLQLPVRKGPTRKSKTRGPRVYCTSSISAGPGGVSEGSILALFGRNSSSCLSRRLPPRSQARSDVTQLGRKARQADQVASKATVVSFLLSGGGLGMVLVLRGWSGGRAVFALLCKRALCFVLSGARQGRYPLSPALQFVRT